MLRNDNILTYQDALDMIVPKLTQLKEQRLLKHWCGINGYNYNNVQLISNHHEKKQFPDTVLRLLIEFGFKVHRINSYVLES
jgi:hypothetical protein